MLRDFSVEEPLVWMGLYSCTVNHWDRAWNQEMHMTIKRATELYGCDRCVSSMCLHLCVCVYMCFIGGDCEVSWCWPRKEVMCGGQTRVKAGENRILTRWETLPVPADLFVSARLWLREFCVCVFCVKFVNEGLCVDVQFVL